MLQQGPSPLGESRALLREYVRRFDGEARKVHARIALYMVWPSFDRRADFDAVRLSYNTAARDIGGLLLPAGDARREAWRRNAGLRLYGGDGFHPTIHGSYLAALVIYQGLIGRPPTPLSSPNMPAADARLLQEAAAASLATR